MIENYPVVGVSLTDGIKVFFNEIGCGTVIENKNKSFVDGQEVGKHYDAYWLMQNFREVSTSPKELALLMLQHME